MLTWRDEGDGLFKNSMVLGLPTLPPAPFRANCYSSLILDRFTESHLLLVEVRPVPTIRYEHPVPTRQSK
jgi:hypothetical protein